MQQLPTMYGPAVHRGKATIHKPCVISVLNNVGGALQTDPVLLPYTSAITKQKKCWESRLTQKFDRFQTLRNNSQQLVTTCNRVFKWTQRATSNYVGSCWPTMLRPFPRTTRLDCSVLDPGFQNLSSLTWGEITLRENQIYLSSICS